MLPAAFIASLGLYTYPQTFIFPPIFFLFVVFYLTAKRKLISHSKQLLIIIFALIIIAIPFINIIRNDKGNFGPQGYVGSKVLPNLSKTPEQLFGKIVSNYKKVILMLHVKGDGTFRVNVSNHPQLDKISGVFFLLGFLYFLKKNRIVWLFYIMCMLLVLPLPSISPAIPDLEIPNSARTIAALPFVFLLISAGFLWSFELLKRTNFKFLGAILITLIYIYAVHLNLKLYFVDYALGLPDKNLGPGRIIANYLDKLPSSVSLYFSSCCWGQWGEPEPKGIAYQLHNQKRFADFGKLIKNCSEIKNHPAVIMTDPRKIDLVDKFMKCDAGSKVMDVFSTNGILVSKLVFIN